MSEKFDTRCADCGKLVLKKGVAVVECAFIGGDHLCIPCRDAYFEAKRKLKGS